MTTLRAGWGHLVVHRQQGLSKMMLASVFFHLFLFLVISLNHVFFGVVSPAFNGFQVSLVAPGPGLSVLSGATGQGGGSKPENAGKRTKKSPRVTKQKGSKGGASARKSTAPKTTDTKPGLKVIPPLVQAVPAQRGANQKAVPADTRTSRRSVRALPLVQEDPEQLQEFWKKRKKKMKRIESPAVKPRMGASKRTRTAKIDITRPPMIGTPPLSSPVVPQSHEPEEKGSSVQEDVEKQEGKYLEDEKGTAFSPESDDTVLPSTGPSANDSESGTGAISIQASVGPGVKGLGTGAGGAPFFFPNYLQKVDLKIRWQWAPPPVTVSGDHLVVRFVIKTDGGIDKNSVEVQESSGNLFFDQAAMRAIYAAHPFPPLPEAYQEESLIVFMNFIVREDS